MIFKATIEDVREITEASQHFRNETDFVPVDVETCVKSYTTAIQKGYGAMFAFRNNINFIVFIIIRIIFYS